MMAAIAMVVLLSVGSPTPTTTVPEAPGAALGLESGPPPSARSRPQPSVAPTPGRPPPRAPTALPALLAGIVLLAGRARRIAAAEQSIRASLQDNLFSDVGRDDLDAIVHRLAGLDPSEATAAVARLSDGEVGVWMRELDGWRGGLDETEQAAYFDTLARKLGPDQLARLTDHGRTTAVVAASLRSSSEAGRVALAIELWTRRSPGDDGWNAIARLVETVPNAALAAGLSATSLPELVENLFEPFERFPGDTPILDLEAAHRLSVAAGNVAVPEVRAELFRALVVQAAATGRIKVAGPIKLPELTVGLAGLLRGSTQSVVADLNHRVDPHANVTSLWVGEMIRFDRLDVLDVLLAELLGGPDRLAYFTEPGHDPANPYPNASNLGYYVGAYGRAIDAIADRAEDRAGLVGQLFALVTGVVPLPGGGTVGIPLGPLVDRHSAGVVEGLQAEASSLKQTLWGLAKPRTSDGRLWNGPGISQFQDAWQEVVDVR